MKQLETRSVYLMPQHHCDIVSIVEQSFMLEKDAVYIRTRKREIVEARQVLCWLEFNKNLKEKGKAFYRKIGEIFPGENGKSLDHATVIHSIKTVYNLMEFNRTFRLKVYKIQNEIYGNVPFILSKN